MTIGNDWPQPDKTKPLDIDPIKNRLESIMHTGNWDFGLNYCRLLVAEVERLRALLSVPEPGDQGQGIRSARTVSEGFDAAWGHRKRRFEDFR